jgi:site-specific DNA recombinase
MKKNPASDQTRSVIYIRVSTKEQDEKYSPEIQEKYCRDYAKEKHLKVIREFREARSGWKLNARIEFYRMLEFIKEEKISHMVYAFGSRVSRNIEDYVLVKGSGVRFHNAITGRSFDPNDPDDYEDTASFEYSLVKDKVYSAELRLRAIDSQRKLIEKGRYPGIPPLGFLKEKVVSEGAVITKIVIDPERGPLVRRLFELARTGEYSRRQLTRKMRDLGLRSRTGRALILAEIDRMLKNSFYCGRPQWFGEAYDNKGTYQPIISRGFFEEVQEALQHKHTKRGKEYKYKGLMTCDLCGCDIIGEEGTHLVKKTGEVRRYPYYHCTSGKAESFYLEKFKQSKCPLSRRPWYREQEIDQFFEMAIESLYVDPETYAWVKEHLEEDYRNLKELHAAEATSLRKEHTEIETKESFIVKRMPSVHSDLARAAYDRELENMERRKVEITDRLNELKSGMEKVSLEEIEDTLELSKALKDKWLAASPEKRARLNKLMFRSVILTVKGGLTTAGAEDAALTLAPFYFVWNEPFKSLWEIGFIQQMAETKAEMKEQEKAKNKVKRAWRDSNSRPAA